MAAIVTRGLAEHRVPWGNMYEFIAAIACMAVLVLIAASVRFRAYYIGLFVLLPVVLALALDVTFVYTPAGSLVPALNSYWIAIHVTAMIIAIGLYIVGAVVTPCTWSPTAASGALAAGLPSRGRGPDDAPARHHRAGPAVLPDDPVRLPGLDVRGHGRRDLGRPRLGPVLGLGPEGDLVVHHLGRLRRLPARPRHWRLARPQAPPTSTWSASAA